LLAYPKTREKAALAMGALFLVRMLVVHAPRLFARPGDGNEWTGAFEMLLLCAGAWSLAPPTERVARVVIAAPLVGLGILHFIYGPFIAPLVPAGLPGRRFWAYFVGVAFVAAAIGFATSSQARLAGTLLGVLWASFVFTLHTPRAIAAHTHGNEWTSLFVPIAP